MREKKKKWVKKSNFVFNEQIVINLPLFQVTLFFQRPRAPHDPVHVRAHPRPQAVGRERHVSHDGGHDGRRRGRGGGGGLGVKDEVHVHAGARQGGGR
jgi:hypothetical protein